MTSQSLAWQAGWAGKLMGRLGRPRMPMSGTRPFCETNSLQWSCGVVGEDRVNELHGVEHVVDQGNRLLLRTGGRAPEVAQWLVLLHCPPPLPPPLPPHHCSPPPLRHLCSWAGGCSHHCGGAGGWSLFGTGRLPADKPGVTSQCANLFEKLDDGGGGGLLEARLVPHQLVHGVAKIGRRVPIFRGCPPP